MISKKQILSPFFFLLISVPVFSSVKQEQKNKEIVRSFYEMSFNQHQPEKAARLYLGKVYTQHNPHVSDGPEAFVSFFKEYYKKNKTPRTSIKRLIAEKDLVVVHAHAQQNAQDRGSAVIDIFRIKNGRIVEHWDVMQKVPTVSKNTNTMF